MESEKLWRQKSESSFSISFNIALPQDFRQCFETIILYSVSFRLGILEKKVESTQKPVVLDDLFFPFALCLFYQKKYTPFQSSAGRPLLAKRCTRSLLYYYLLK